MSQRNLNNPQMVEVTKKCDIRRKKSSQSIKLMSAMYFLTKKMFVLAKIVMRFWGKEVQVSWRSSSQSEKFQSANEAKVRQENNSQFMLNELQWVEIYLDLLY